MDWVWALYSKYIMAELQQQGNASPTDDQVEAAFISALAESSITILVQEPFQNSVRFKGLARDKVLNLSELLTDPITYLARRFGGGKFKLNFHRGWNFVATRNFKPEGEPLWMDLPEIEF